MSHAFLYVMSLKLDFKLAEPHNMISKHYVVQTTLNIQNDNKEKKLDSHFSSLFKYNPFLDLLQFSYIPSIPLLIFFVFLLS